MNTCKPTLLVTILLLLTAFALSKAESPAGSNVSPQAGKYAHVQVIGYASGMTGFFDTTNGRLYLYTMDMQTPYMVTEIQSLGQPLRVIRPPRAN